jgi:putative transposase
MVSKTPIDLPAQWGGYVDEPLTEKEMERLRESVNRQAPYGDQAWQMKTSEAMGLQSSIRHRGRPRKDEANEKK